jgi:hypothetical protein
MKTSELTGAALDWAIGKIDQPQWTDEDLRWITLDYCDIGDADDEPYSPSTDWAQGGPIIERECIDLQAYDACSEVPKNPDCWEASIYLAEEIERGEGPTPLIAAMRCYVASKLGDEVEVPAEVIS